MRKKLLAWAGLFLALPGMAAAQSTQPTNINQAIDRIIAREHEELTTLRQYSPVIETYIQEMRPDVEMGAVPVKDHYFIGQANLNQGIIDDSMLAKHRDHNLKSQLNPLKDFASLMKAEYTPRGFLQMIYVDSAGFDRSNYKFEYVRREFLGEVRCLVFDVTPQPHAGRGRFKGRIWVEDQDYTIVRFNGLYVGDSGFGEEPVHFDSWRINVRPDLWLPTYVFSQQTDPRGYYGGHIEFRGQSRLWGYDLKDPNAEDEFSQLTVESNNVQDQSAGPQDPSPVEAERLWQQQAVDNVLERLVRSGLAAPPGPVDKVLNTVVNNIEVTNNLDIQPEVQCRVLLTSRLESFSIGHTIVISRGLLDVLPDEVSLASMLARELADILELKTNMDRWGFNDETLLPSVEVLSHFDFQDSPQDENAINQKAYQLLRNSPYKDKLSSAGLFMKQLQESSATLTSLISSNLGNRVTFAQQIEEGTPQLQPHQLNQIAALPLGARIKLDPYSDKVEMLKTKPVALISDREKMPFGITPFVPYLMRYSPATSANAAPGAPRTDAAQTQEPE